MAKKRKGGSRPQESSGPNLDVGESRKRIRTYEDVADSDDDFHDSRDRILLDEAPEAKRRRKLNEEEEFLEPSDEEILGYSESEESEEEDKRQPRSGRSAKNAAAADSDVSGDEGEEVEEELGWGTSKADLYGADAIETEEQALEEEAEALRLQKKQLQAMSAADYGFDEADWQAGEVEEAAEVNEVVTEVLPELQIAEDMDEAQRRKLLKSRYPEFEPLSQELVRMRTVVEDLQENMVSGGPNASTKFRAASAYLGVLTMYFALLASTASQGNKGVTALSATILRDHPVMDSLIECRTLWQKVEQLPEDDDVDDSGLGSSDAAEGAGLDDLADDMLTKDARELLRPTNKLSRAQRHAAAAQAAADARRAERLKRTEAGLADLDMLLAASSRSKTKDRKRATGPEDDSDVGEEAPLSAHEAAEKARRKKSLRFYTSQIAQKANKRGATGRSAGGDEDIPHRERLRDRQARLNAEAEKRGRSGGDGKADLGGDSDDEDARQAEQIRAEADDDNEYYDMVASRTSKKKADKAAMAELQKQAASQGGRVVEEETVGADGKRKISYLIEKNKGLTPHRKKDVRNPRVKKRKKYEEKKKKLSSMKAVYKGGEGRGGYGGELTGIKKGLVRSTKL